MLRLRLPTDPRWANIAEDNLEAILTDHAFCEQKAASNAISIMVQYTEYTDIVQQMTAIAQEELEHFKLVHDIIIQRGYTFGRKRKDDYVGDLMKFLKIGANREEYLVERLLFSAMIEARSCERFRVLSENISDKELAAFYNDLMVSEANHYTTFISLARKYNHGINVDARWQEFLDYEAKVIANYGKKETIHG